jgi:hypothetical protein
MTKKSISLLLGVFLVAMTCFCVSCTNDSVKQSRMAPLNESISMQEICQDVSIPQIDIVDQEGTYQYLYPAYESHYQELGFDDFSSEFLVWENNLFFTGLETGLPQVFQIGKSEPVVRQIKLSVGSQSRKTDSISYAINPVYPSSPPMWSKTEIQERIQSVTQDFKKKAYLLKNTYSPTTSFDTLQTTPVHSQLLQVIDLSTNQVLREVTLPQETPIQRIRCVADSFPLYRVSSADIPDKSERSTPIFFVYSSSETPNALHTLFIEDPIKEDESLVFDQNILAWNAYNRELIVLLEDHSVERYTLFWNQNKVHFVRQKVLPSIPYTLTKPDIVMNPSENSYTIWETIPQGNTWFLSEKMPKPTWFNMNVSCYTVVSPYISNRNETRLDEDTSKLVKSDFTSGIKGEVSLNETSEPVEYTITFKAANAGPILSGNDTIEIFFPWQTALSDSIHSSGITVIHDIPSLIGPVFEYNTEAWMLKDFMIFAKLKPEQSLLTWGEIGMQSGYEEMYKEWMSEYTPKSMIDGRYIEN